MEDQVINLQLAEVEHEWLVQAIKGAFASAVYLADINNIQFQPLADPVAS